MKLKMGLGIFGLLVLMVVFYLTLPVLSVQFLHVPVIVFTLALCVFLISFIDAKELNENTKLTFTQKVTGLVSVVALIYIGVAIVASSAIFTWETKQTELNLVEISEFDVTVPNVDMDNLIVLDEQDALRTSEKLITEKNPTLGSIFQIGEGTLSVVEGKPYWIFPMEYRGFFKWFGNRGELPGYIKVSATDFNDATFVDQTFGISPTGYFSQDLKRVIYKQYSGYGLTDYSFEVDETGKGFWVVTAYSRATWVSTNRVEGTIIVDPVTGSMTFHKVGEQPEWVDRVFDTQMFGMQLDWYGKYINGWWNPSDEGKLQNTEGMGYVFKNENLYFYTGMTSVGKDSATTGFVIYNPRTGEAEYNRLSGLIEQKAMGLMEELVQNAGYTSRYPYLINLNGEPTYFSALKGNSGNVVGYAFASVSNYKAVAWGKTLREAQTEYNRALLREGQSNSISAQTLDLERIEGVVSRVGALKEGYYAIKLESKPRLYLISSEQFPLIALTQAGDIVSIGHLKSDEAEKIDAIEFVNKSIK